LKQFPDLKRSLMPTTDRSIPFHCISQEFHGGQPFILRPPKFANEIFSAVETIGLPECGINLAHGTTYLSQCKKDRSAYDAYYAALKDVKKYGNLPIPLKIRNAVTNLMKNIGYGKGYEKYTTNDLLPEKLKGRKYLK